MYQFIESIMYDASQIFLVPVLFAIAGLFLYAFYALGAFGWQSRQRRRRQGRGFELEIARLENPGFSLADLEALAVRRLEFVRICSRIAPMLGLVATMIPMGPALKALADGKIADVSHNLAVAFSAVILALISATLTHCVANVRRRWYASDLLSIEQGLSRPFDANLPKAGNSSDAP